jgi:Uncharacterized conserved protein
MKTRAKKKAGPPPPDPHEQCCPDDPCLFMLRDAAIAERETIFFYLEAAAMVCGDLRRLFIDTAQDEMRHFVLIMHRLSALDPVQAEALEKAGLAGFLWQRAVPPKWAADWHPACACPPEAEPELAAPEEADTDMTAVCLLTKALTGELAAINKYQEYMEKSASSSCCRYFCHLMNEEKVHAAEFIAALYDLTGEPPPEEAE